MIKNRGVSRKAHAFFLNEAVSGITVHDLQFQLDAVLSEDVS
jgi:hypothetical protein